MKQREYTFLCRLRSMSSPSWLLSFPAFYGIETARSGMPNVVRIRGTLRLRPTIITKTSEGAKR